MREGQEGPTGGEVQTRRKGSTTGTNTGMGVAGKHAITMLVQLHDNYRPVPLYN